jgi:hypothetical protein
MVIFTGPLGIFSILWLLESHANRDSKPVIKRITAVERAIFLLVKGIPIFMAVKVYS